MLRPAPKILEIIGTRQIDPRIDQMLAQCGARGRPASMRKQFFYERECVHRDRGAEGELYNGLFFIKALQRLQSNDAVKMAGKVAPFYWVDAPRVLVWLCRECAAELQISDAPRAIVLGARH